MASFPCPYCGQNVTADDDEPLEQCPSCAGGLDIAYRYRLVSYRGKLAGGLLYEAVDEGFAEKLAVIFAAKVDDAEATRRFEAGNRLFADLGGGRGLVRVLELSSRSDRRPYVVIEWINEGTLESRVAERGPLDHPTLIEATGDLITGLAKAHRSMPSIVHNHIHPGKIGFLSEDEIVLFGFEWAEQVFEQDSNLADTFLSETDNEAAPSESKRAADLRRLGQSLYYAATGEWLADAPLSQQRERARAKVQGPLAVFLDRMLSAGRGGYETAVDAVGDFQRLVRGELSVFRPRSKPKHRPRSDDDFAASSFAVPTATEGYDDYNDAGSDDYDYDELDADDYELAEDEMVAALGVGRSSSATPATLDQRMEAFSIAAAQQQRQAQAQTEQASGAKAVKLIWIIMASLVGFGMCVASIADDAADDFEEEPVGRVQRGLPPNIEPIPREVYEPPPMPEPAVPLPPSGGLSSTFRYEGKINGPQDLAGAFELGDPCTIWVEPNEGELNCRWYIDCGERKPRRIYGGGTAGYSTCEVSGEGFPLRAADEDDDSPDGAFVAELDGPAPMVMVLDRWLLPPTRVAIQITSAATPYAGRVPNVRQAKRVDSELIEARIAADDWPTFPGEAEAEADERADADADADALPDRLTASDLRSVLQTAAPRFEQCMDEPGEVARVKITILGSGHVLEASVDPDLGLSVDSCLTQVARSLRFPRFVADQMNITWKVRG